MNTIKKLIFATLIIGSAVPAIQAYSWTPKTIAAVTLAGLGFGTAATIKYYGFNSITNAVLEKCANAKNWFSGKLSDAVYGSYKKQIQSLRAAQTKHLERIADEQAILKQEIKEVLSENNAQLVAQEADRKDAHERAISLTKQIVAQQQEYKKLLAEKERVESTMRGTINGLNSRSTRHETDKKSALAEVERHAQIIAQQEQTIAELQQMLTQMQEKLAAQENATSSDEKTSESEQSAQAE